MPEKKVILQSINVEHIYEIICTIDWLVESHC